jgi:hypothetical protein
VPGYKNQVEFGVLTATGLDSKHMKYVILERTLDSFFVKGHISSNLIRMPCSIISKIKFLGSSQNIDLSIWDAQEMSIPSKSLCVLKAYSLHEGIYIPYG